MLRWMKFGSAALLASVTSVAIGQEQNAAAPQAARWHLDGATNRCVLTRRLEGSPGPATLILRTIPGSYRYELILARPELPATIGRHGRPTTIILAPDAGHYEGQGRLITLPGTLGRGASFGPFPAAFRRQLAATSSLRLAASAGAEVGNWTIPGAARAAEALAACEAEKQIDWGADEASVESGARPPQAIGDTSAWLTPRDLGVGDALASAAFTAVFRLVVEPDGSVGSCTLLEAVTNIANPGDVCRMLVRRARYQPARNATGTPVRSVAIHTSAVQLEVEFRVIGA